MTRSADWEAGYALGHARQPYLRDDEVSEDFVDGYVHGRAQAECERAKIKIDRDVGMGFRRMLRALGWTR